MSSNHSQSRALAQQNELFATAQPTNDNFSAEDLLVLGQRKLANLRRRLLQIPVREMGTIMELNREIAELEQVLEQADEQVGGPNKQAN